MPRRRQAMPTAASTSRRPTPCCAAPSKPASTTSTRPTPITTAPANAGSARRYARWPGTCPDRATPAWPSCAVGSKWLPSCPCSGSSRTTTVSATSASSSSACSSTRSTSTCYMACAPAVSPSYASTTCWAGLRRRWPPGASATWDSRFTIGTRSSRRWSTRPTSGSSARSSTTSWTRSSRRAPAGWSTPRAKGSA